MDNPTSTIIRVLKENPEGLSITDISSIIGLNRNSIARYLDVMKNSGIVSERTIGPARLYKHEGQLPYKEQIELYKKAMDSASCGITISDALQDDIPLIYANEEFLKMTGYSKEEVIGRNCRFLQGNDNKQPQLKKVRDSLKKGLPCKVTLRNYSKDGKLFYNELRLSPIHDNEGIITHYVGIQTIVDK
ncbi:MAG: PAS domain-containing protein [Candidatus Woesearchaeota archaeon]